MQFDYPFRAKVYIIATVTTGALVLAVSLLHWQCADPLKLVSYILLAIFGSTYKVRLPGMESTMSPNAVFIMLAVIDLSPPEAIAVAFASSLTQCLWKPAHKPEVVKVSFSVMSCCIAVWIACEAFSLSARFVHFNIALMLLFAAFVYYAANTLSISAVIALCAEMPLLKTWRSAYLWTMPMYLAGATVAGLVVFCNRFLGWPSSLLLIPGMYMIFRAYELQLEGLKNESKRIEIEKLHWETEKLHAQEIYDLHLRTIEGLALAIDAKDHTTHEHLLRVRCYCMEIGKEMGFSSSELDGLRAASLLHDIGKLAVPDHIINKPGRLRQEEFEKMKIHPVIGAEILKRISFPYPVAPIVHAHHEKWNGEGYPLGLKGEEIPLGARILSAVDALDALASDRQYRKALPLDEAMASVAAESGTSFDPAVIAVLQLRYRELEALSIREMEEAKNSAFSFGSDIKQGNRPASGLEPEQSVLGPNNDYLQQIALARTEAHTLFEMSLDLGYSLSMVETLSLVSMRLAKLVPFDTILFYVRNEEMLIPEFVSGENEALLTSRTIPVGTGICGWVAQNAKPIVNANPAVEPWFAESGQDLRRPRSALAMPFEGIAGLQGVLVLYHSEVDAFTAEHLRVLQVVSTRIAMFVENALKYLVAETFGKTDHLTGLANVRSLAMYMEQEMARCRRENTGFAVMVCDLNGFKQVNDHFGHQTGDLVLKRFATLLRESCREYDYIARMGGDEFVIIAPNMSAASVDERAALLNGLARQAGVEASEQLALSLSLGAAFYPQDGSDPQQLLAEADKRMYSVKKHFYVELNASIHRNLDTLPADRIEQNSAFALEPSLGLGDASRVDAIAGSEFGDGL